MLLRLPRHAIRTVTHLQEDDVAVFRDVNLNRPIPVLGGVANEFRHRQDHVISIHP